MKERESNKWYKSNHSPAPTARQMPSQPWITPVSQFSFLNTMLYGIDYPLVTWVSCFFCVPFLDPFWPPAHLILRQWEKYKDLTSHMTFSETARTLVCYHHFIVESFIKNINFILTTASTVYWKENQHKEKSTLEVRLVFQPYKHTYKNT